jgi:hypothetical protein
MNSTDEPGRTHPDDDAHVMRFAFGDVVVEDATRTRPSGRMPALGQWPCPGCGNRRIVDDTWILVVRDHPNGRNRREVMVCGLCASGVARTSSSPR